MRSMLPGFAAALAAQDVRPALLFEGVFPSGSLLLWTGQAPLVWGGRTWQGAGSLISVEGMDESADIVAQGARVTLSGVPSLLVSAAITDAQQGLPGLIYIVLRDAAGQVIPDPIIAFQGRLDVPTIVDGQDTCAISVTYESQLIDLTRPREWRYTHESQQVLFPGDLGFSYVTTIQDKEIIWGR